MRTVTDTLRDAITLPESARYLVKVVIDPSRTFFATLTANFPYGAGDYSVPTNDPVGQCMCYYNGNAYTFVVNPSTGGIVGMAQGSATQHSLGVSADPDSKPACISLGDGTAYLWYWNGSALMRVTVNLSGWGTSGSTNMNVPAHGDWTVVGGSPSAISSTQVAFFYKTSKGGMGVDYYDGSWHSWSKRFMSPKALTETKWTIHTAAAALGNSIFFYSTDMDPGEADDEGIIRYTAGEVRGVEYRSNHSVWTDSFTALPADLSRFCLGNAVTANGYIHLAGQFHRTEDLTQAKVHSLVVRSRDGRTFSWDRFTLLSTLGYQFQIDLDTVGLRVFASDRNCVGVADMSYFFCTTPSTQVILQPPSDIISFAMSNASSASLRVSSYNEQYMFSPVIKKGSRAQVYLGMLTSAGEEYTLLQTYIIATRRQGFSAGKRQISLTLEDEGSWKVNQIAFPFYSEILSKITLGEDCDENDHLYPVATKTPGADEMLIIDFWDNEEWDGDGVVSGTPIFWGLLENRTNDPVIWTHDDAETYLFRTADLNSMDQIDEYPLIVEGQTVSASLYGWERTFDDPDTRQNSDWTLYAVTAPADDLEDKTVIEGTVTTTRRFPRDYPTFEAGAYPIGFEWSGLTAEHKLLYIGVKVYNPYTGKSTAVPERIEITGVDFSYSSTESAKLWKPVNPDPTTYTREYLKMPDTGLPSMEFATKPYAAFKFSTAAEFIYIPGATPLGSGITGWGVCGIAMDGRNAIVGRYNRQNSSHEILKVREGIETVLKTQAAGTTDSPTLMLNHRDGLLTLCYQPAGTWIVSTSYVWDEIAQGVMSMSKTGIMHTGIYGAIVPPGFYAAGFSATDCKGIAMIPGFSPQIIEDFPASGTVVCQGKQYTFTGKVYSYTKPVYGPYEGRQSGDYGTYTEPGVTFSGYAGEIALYKPNNPANACQNLIFAIQSGHTWKIINSDWTVTHYNSGTPNPLRNRSRHYAEGANGNVVVQRSRHYIANGLTGIGKVDSGSTPIHPNWCYVTIASSDVLYAKRLIATQVDTDATVEDMIRYLAATACVETEFPGNWSSPAISLTGAPTQLASGVKQFPGGFDIRLTIPSLSAGQWVGVYASNLYLKNPANANQSEAIDFRIRNNGGTLEVVSLPKSGYNTAEYVAVSHLISAGVAHDMRFLFHGEFCSIYADGVWLATFAYGEKNLIFPPADGQLTLYAYASTSIEVTDVTLGELFDWREAIYVESELSAKSALGSVIQERPVEMAPTRTGGLQFSYFIKRDEVTYDAPTCKRIFLSHEFDDLTSPDAGSDAIVYFKDVTFATSPDFAEEEGFLTRVYKLSGLDTGAETAASILLEKAFEKQFQHAIIMRPDPRVEIGDRVIFTYIVPGTAREVTYEMIVEDTGMSFEEGNYVATLKGRQDV